VSVFINKDTKVIVQGITGSTALFHTKQMLEYGTQIVGGTSPGKGGLEVEGVPVFNTVKDAVEAIFGVKVEKVNVMNYKGKFKRMGKHAGYTNRRRKAIVKLTADSQDIQLFEGV